jgi:hypothetical protein
LYEALKIELETLQLKLNAANGIKKKDAKKKGAKKGKAGKSKSSANAADLATPNNAKTYPENVQQEVDKWRQYETIFIEVHLIVCLNIFWLISR